MSITLAQRISGVRPSATLAITARAKAMRADGIDVLAMSAGEPDFDTPESIKNAAKAALDIGDTKYAPVPGKPALREAICADATDLYGTNFAVGDEALSAANVIVGVGGKHVLFNAIACLVDPGDDVLFGSPYWVSYPDMVRFAGGNPIPVENAAGGGQLPTANDFSKALSSNTRLIILNSPSNPTGQVYAESELRAIADMLRKAVQANPRLLVITDDIYARLVYDETFVSIARPDLCAGFRDRLFVASGVSKTYAMTGWRIGYGIGPEELIAGMSRLQGASTSGACSIAQAAALEALSGDHTAVHKMRDEFSKRRDRIVEGLMAIPHVQLPRPGGAFYAFPNISHYFGGKVENSLELCAYLLNEQRLAVVPGSAFGADAHIRLSFACSTDTIDDALSRLVTGLRSLA